MATQQPKRSPSDNFFIFLLTLGQIVGVLPLEFSSDGGKHSVRFNWTSYKTIYALFHMFLQTFMVFMCMFFGHFSSTGWNFRHIVRTLFYATNLWCSVALFQIVKRWPKLMKQWGKIDEAMEVNYGYPKNLNKRCKLTSVAAVMFSMAHIFIFLLYNFFLTKGLAETRKATFGPEFYSKIVFPQIFAYVPYTLGTGLLFQLNYIFCCVRMIYTDLFISLLSSFLSIRFQQITNRLNTALNQKKEIEFWKQIREDYDRVSTLCRAADEIISNVVFVSYSANLMLLLVYLRNATVIEGANIQKVYNILCFTIFVVRLLVISLYVAWVNDESKEPSSILNSVSTTQYNSEIHRFILQISFDCISFTGNKMFKVTRGIILNIGGIVLTYELMLVQFAELKIAE